MKTKPSFAKLLIACAVGLILILDAKTAFSGASQGLSLCIRTVIPSLFPFFVLSYYLTGLLTGGDYTLLRPFGRLLRIPQGAEGILLLGLLGGYPTGAGLIAQCRESGQLSGSDAKRLLGFCNQPGPAFIFGILSGYFHETGEIWLIWGIVILSALFTALLLPGGSPATLGSIPRRSVSLRQALHHALKTCAEVCGWVILFRVLICFLERWFLWLLPVPLSVLVSGLTELTNGCSALSQISLPGTRFILCALMLSAGGLCVAMQTVTVSGRLGPGLYFPGKFVQTLLAAAMAGTVQYWLYPTEQQAKIPAGILHLLLLLPILFMISKKEVEKILHPLYNRNIRKIAR